VTQWNAICCRTCSRCYLFFQQVISAKRMVRAAQFICCSAKLHLQLGQQQPSDKLKWVQYKIYGSYGCNLSVGLNKIFSYSSNQGGSEEHISLKTVLFYFNEFAFTVQVKHKIDSTQILGFILICLYFATNHFHTCVLLCKECSQFPFNYWLSFQRLCRLLWGCTYMGVKHSCSAALAAITTQLAILKLIKTFFTIKTLNNVH